MSDETFKLLDRDGRFMAKPIEWAIEKEKADSKSVGVRVTFAIGDTPGTAQYVDGQWQPWEEYEKHVINGRWYPIKKDGTVNQMAIEQLVRALGWNGNLAWFKNPPMPETELVQITVKTETYTGNDGSQKSGRKATWMDPKDYVPTFGGASDDDVDSLQGRYGSLLKAAASSIKEKDKKAAMGGQQKKAAPPAA